MKNVDKYNTVISGFAADLSLSLNDPSCILYLRDMIESKDEDVLRNIDLINELDYNLRNGKLKIVECDK